MASNNTRIHAPDVSTPTFSSPLDQIRVYTSKIEDGLAVLAEPIKPYVFANE